MTRRRSGRARGTTAAALAALAVLVSGCQHWPMPRELPEDKQQQQTRQPPPRAETPAQVRGREIAGLLDYFRGVQMAPRAVLEERSTHLAARIQEGKCDGWRLKYAMVAKALAPPQDAPQARQFLEPCLASQSPANNALGEFAYLLEELWEAQAVSVQYRDQLQRTRRALEAERSETAKLRQQLEGLKAIEQSIQQRDREKGASGSQ